MPAFLIASRQLGHMPPTDYLKPPANCHKSSATCQLQDKNFHLKFVFEKFLSARYFFARNLFHAKKNYAKIFFCQRNFSHKIDTKPRPKGSTVAAKGGNVSSCLSKRFQGFQECFSLVDCVVIDKPKLLLLIQYFQKAKMCRNCTGFKSSFQM